MYYIKLGVSIASWVSKQPNTEDIMNLRYIWKTQIWVKAEASS